MKFNYYQDPGHGWVKVPRRFLSDLGILGKITGYSYQRGDHVYLEEDCDVTTLAKALEAKGHTLEMKVFHSNKRSKIRSYASFAKHIND